MNLLCVGEEGDIFLLTLFDLSVTFNTINYDFVGLGGIRRHNVMVVFLLSPKMVPTGLLRRDRSPWWGGLVIHSLPLFFNLT